MADLHEVCEAAGLDSSKYRPIAHATESGRVAVYIGAAWQELPRGKAANLRDQITRALDELRHRQALCADELGDKPAPANFSEQLERFRRLQGSNAIGLAELSTVARELTEARALAELSKEPQP